MEVEPRECCDARINEYHRDGCSNQVCVDCGKLTSEGHNDDCLVMLKLAASYMKDSSRWVERYVTNNSENMRKRVIAASNGHAGSKLHS